MNKILLAVLAALVKVLPKKQFKLGEGYVNRYTIFEFRNLCSLYLHEISTNCQDRFHTHAFNAWAYCLSGGYIDEVKDQIGSTEVSFIEIKPGLLRYIPRLFNHRLTKAQLDTYTLLLCGPYSDLWTEEYENGQIDLLTKHRKIIKSVSVIK